MKSEFEKWYRDKYQVTKQLYFFEDTQRYEDGFAQDAWEVWQHQQSKVDELQRRNQMLNNNIKEQGQKLVYQNEVIETQAEKLLGLRDEKAELQKRVDAAQKLIDDWNCGGVNLFDLLDELEQALKGGEE